MNHSPLSNLVVTAHIVPPLSRCVLARSLRNKPFHRFALPFSPVSSACSRSSSSSSSTTMYLLERIVVVTVSITPPSQCNHDRFRYKSDSLHRLKRYRSFHEPSFLPSAFTTTPTSVPQFVCNVCIFPCCTVPLWLSILDEMSTPSPSLASRYPCFVSFFTLSTPHKCCCRTCKS